VVTLISDEASHPARGRALMLESLEQHRDVVEAIRARDGAAANRISCRTLYDRYQHYVPREDLRTLRAMLDPRDRDARPDR
jgi:DNA-binding FadR family transcriptional regulator